MIFSGMSGSALADAAGPGKLEVDMMVKAGYSPGFSAALSTTSAIIGPIIPPSIPMVIYGVVSNTSIGYLFMGGVIPGLLLARCPILRRGLLSRRRNFPTEPPPTLRYAVGATLSALPALMLPAIMLGGIYSGAVTPTEAAAVCAAFWRWCWHSSGIARSVSPSLSTCLSNRRGPPAIVAITIAGALVMNWIVAAEQIPERMGLWMSTLDLSPVVFLLMVNILFLILGAFLDTLLMLLIIVPMLMPTVIHLGIDPVHFGVVSVVNMMIGLVTPPMGELVFLIAGVSGIKVAEITKELWIFLFVLIALLFVLVFVPQITLWLPELMGYEPLLPVVPLP